KQFSTIFRISSLLHFLNLRSAPHFSLTILLTCILSLVKESILARIDNEFNAVIVNGDSVGEVSFVGKGAGSLATGSAVYSDVI
ncbi:hypothetical protein EWM17_19680, partial [Clostridioides difficile]